MVLAERKLAFYCLFLISYRLDQWKGETGYVVLVVVVVALFSVGCYFWLFQLIEAYYACRIQALDP